MEIVVRNQCLAIKILKQSKNYGFQERLFGVVKTVKEDWGMQFDTWQTENQFTELRQTIQELTQQNEELTKRVTDLEADHLKDRRKAQALEGIDLLAEAAKEL